MSQLNQSRNSSMDGGPGFIPQNQNLMQHQHQYQQHPTVQQPTPAPASTTATLPNSNSNSHPTYALQRTNSVTYSTTNPTNNINQQDSSNKIINQNTNNTTFSGTNDANKANRTHNVSQSTTSNLSCSTSASSIRSYSESPPPDHIILQNQIVYNSINSTKSNNRGISISPASPTTSLRSRTFDLEREFSGTGDGKGGGHGNKGKGVSRGDVKTNHHLNNDIQEFKSQSSSPSVEDTIIARGVTYTADPAVARQPHLILSPRYQSIQHQQQNQSHNHNYNPNSNSSMQGQGQGQVEHTTQNNTNHNHIQNSHPYLVTKDSIGSTDELLSVDVRHFQNNGQNQYRAQLIQPNQIQSQSHNHYNHQTQVQQIHDLTDDEDSLSILNNYKQYQNQKQQHQQQHHHDDNTTYVVKTGAGTGIGSGTGTGAGPGKTQNYYSPGAKMITRQRAEERETTPPSLKSTILDLDDETFRGLKAGVDSPPVPHVNGYGKSFRQRHPNQMPSSELHHHAVQDGTTIYKTQIPNQNHHQNHNNLNHHQPNQANHHNYGTGGKHVQFSLKNRYCKSKTHFAPNLSLTDILSKIFLGNSPLVRDVLEKKQYKVRWSPIIFLECFLRSVSAVSLAPNPLSGALIFVAMLIITPLAAMLGSLALISGILTAIFLVQMPLELVRSGGVTFNSYLLGTAIGELSSEEIWKDRADIFALSIALGSLIIFVCCGLDGIVSRRGAVRLPLLNSPFNLTALLYVTSGLAGLYKAGTTTDLSPPFQGIDLRFGIDGNNLSVTPLPGSVPAIPPNSNANINPNSNNNNNGDTGIPGDTGDFRGISLLSLNNVPSNSGAVPGSSYGADTLSLGLGSYNSNNKNQSINLTLWDMPDNLGFEQPQPPENITIDWVLILQGVLLAPSQFYGTKTMWSSAIVYLAWLLFSPILFCQTIVGAFIGNLIGIVLDDPPYTNLYTGGWAYNALLTSSAIGGLYYIFNLKSWLMSVVGSVLSTLVFAGMLKANLPTLGIPFMFITWVLIPATFNYQQEDTGTGTTDVKKPIGSMNCAWNSNRRDDEPFMKKWMTLMRVPMDQVQTPEIHLMEHWKCHRKGIARIIPALSKVSAATAELHI